MRFGKSWPKHYNGGARKDIYLERWKKTRAWAASVKVEVVE